MAVLRQSFRSIPCRGPLTQYHLAHALGLSAVHANRVRHYLRDDGLVSFRQGRVQVGVFNHLRKMANFGTAYLDQDGPFLR
jgi:Crp-like helix-turn-helix domain